ncbi:MAG: SUMF1/EgtB/PvdO family nonheme iron enzyme [Thiolinea sp.]
MAQNVFVSYSWSVERETGIVAELEKHCQSRHIHLLQDNNEIKHGELIREFMDKLTGGEHVITIFSKPYFQSPWCMYELLRTWQKGDFQQRTHPIIADDCNLQDRDYRISVVKFWLAEYAKVSASLAGVDPSLIGKEYEKANIIRDISQNANELMNFAAGRLNTSLADLRTRDYAPLLESIQADQSTNTPARESSNPQQPPTAVDVQGGIHVAGGAIGAAVISGGSITQNNTFNSYAAPVSDDEMLQREKAYLGRVIGDCGGLDWLTLIGEEGYSANLELEAVYTALLTTTMEAPHDRQPDERQQKPLSALGVLDRENRLVLTGDPGSGKSAFVNYLALCMAGEKLGHEHINLQTLTAPLPKDDGEPQTEEVEVEGQDGPQQREVWQNWGHGALLPIRIILRDFSASQHFPDEGDKGDACHLLNFLRTLQEKAGFSEHFAMLEQRLLQGQALVMFDGLDEVPQAGDRRKRLVECIEGFAKSYRGCRVLVTCRPYAYRDPQWHIRGFGVTHLAPFSRGQIIRFIQRWYASLPSVDSARGDRLQTVILGKEALEDMAKRPLLLSLIAYLDGCQYDLPERRAELYAKLLELLVNRWEKKRFDADDSKKAEDLQQYSLAAFLHVGHGTIRKVLERLAFRAHALQDAKQRETADIAEKDLIWELHEEARRNGRKIDLEEICGYLRDRVGILFQRGGANDFGAVYTFPHRSFQEYLAAAYFRRGEKGLFREHPNCRKWYDVAARLGKTDPDRWREVVVLTGGIDAQTTGASDSWELLDTLCPERDNGFDAQTAWGLRLAAEIMVESLNLHPEEMPDWQQDVLERIRNTLPQALRTPHLPAVERAAIGRYLAVIGDPRPEVMTVEAMQFMPIPAGKFWMGKGEHDEDDEEFLLSEKPAGWYDLNYAYQMAKYPVTVAQFQQFVDAPETKAAGFKLGNENALHGVANSPVVYVSQQEAMQFCRWLTDYLHKEGKLAVDLCITLPDEAEWGKAARGSLDDNPEPQRRYPWGNEITDEHLNYNMTIGQVTTPGIYPQGSSPYGCEDMVGNVWEWTRSESGKYSYPDVGTDEWKQRTHSNGDRAVCVLRGGAFGSNLRLVRCAVRGGGGLGYRSGYVGFRCCVVPITLYSEASGR